MNRPAFQNTRLTIGCKGFRSFGANEKGLSPSTAFTLSCAYANRQCAEEPHKRLRAESDAATFESHSDRSSPPLTQSPAFSIFNAKMVTALVSSPEAPTDLEQQKSFKSASDIGSCPLDAIHLGHSSSSTDMLNFEKLTELQDFDFWFNGVTY